MPISADQDRPDSSVETALPSDPPLTASTPAGRALTEAAARRSAIDAKAEAVTRISERGGRGGLDPVRYDDWEIGGRAVDF